MEIDWSKAPEGTTHFNTGMNSRVDGWMKSENEIWHWWPSTGASIEKKWYPLLNQLRIYTDRFIERPVAWTGEGLPPVGIVCENKFLALWKKVKIIGHDNDKAIFRLDDDYQESYFAGSLGEFRPIRTAEQMAAEERENELNRMVATVSMLDKGWARKVCAGLYDAGYRQQVKP